MNITTDTAFIHRMMDKCFPDRTVISIEPHTFTTLQDNYQETKTVFFGSVTAVSLLRLNLNTLAFFVPAGTSANILFDTVDNTTLTEYYTVQFCGYKIVLNDPLTLDAPPLPPAPPDVPSIAFRRVFLKNGLIKVCGYSGTALGGGGAGAKLYVSFGSNTPIELTPETEVPCTYHGVASFYVQRTVSGQLRTSTIVTIDLAYDNDPLEACHFAFDTTPSGGFVDFAFNSDSAAPINVQVKDTSGTHNSYVNTFASQNGVQHIISNYPYTTGLTTTNYPIARFIDLATGDTGIGQRSTNF